MRFINFGISLKTFLGEGYCFLWWKIHFLVCVFFSSLVD